MQTGEPRTTARQRGFTYLGILIAVAIMGIATGAASTLWSVAAKREKEAELLFIGHQFRNAIADYYAAPGTGTQYPRELNDLVEDHRTPAMRHHLRRIFRDPMTGKADWQVIRTGDGSIIGIASSSDAVPLKRAHFTYADATFEDVSCYCDWRFLYQPVWERMQPAG